MPWVGVALAYHAAQAGRQQTGWTAGLSRGLELAGALAVTTLACCSAGSPATHPWPGRYEIIREFLQLGYDVLLRWVVV